MGVAVQAPEARKPAKAKYRHTAERLGRYLAGYTSPYSAASNGDSAALDNFANKGRQSKCESPDWPRAAPQIHQRASPPPRSGTYSHLALRTSNSHSFKHAPCNVHPPMTDLEVHTVRVTPYLCSYTGWMAGEAWRFYSYVPGAGRAFGAS